jgi:hypothetical protein
MEQYEKAVLFWGCLVFIFFTFVVGFVSGCALVLQRL